MLALIECKRFEQQTPISAIPHAQEFQEISSMMPQGIGPIGIFHSHPSSSEIFHSHTDDSTLLSLTNQFPSCVSIITNGKVINYYQMGKKSKIEEVQAEFINPDIPQFLLISIDEFFLLKISNNILNHKTDEHKLKIMILNKLRDFLEEIWNEFELSYKASKISENDSIKPYLVNKLTAEPVQLIFPEKIKERNKIKLILDNINESEAIKTTNYQASLDLKIKVKIPIYIIDENVTFQKVYQAIKTELISNNILQKIYNCVIDYDKNIIITPDDCYLNFFGFYIRFLFFKNSELNKNELSQKNLEILLKLIALFENIEELELNIKIRSQILRFIKNIKKFSNKFR